MKTHVAHVILAGMVLWVTGCKAVSVADDEELQLLKSWMIGSFNSLEQSSLDSNFYNIHLEMVPIWEDQKDAIYLYVEQAASWALDKPYRQRVYRLSRDERGGLESAVYMLDNPLRFAGAWETLPALTQLTPDSISIKEGCEIKLTPLGGVFIGGTEGQGCLSQLRGAAYATSEVRIEKEMLTSWDRGFDSTDTQVWGAVTGPYIFKKQP